jgi:hypothetical protein
MVSCWIRMAYATYTLYTDDNENIVRYLYVLALAINAYMFSMCLVITTNWKHVWLRETSQLSNYNNQTAYVAPMLRSTQNTP